MVVNLSKNQTCTKEDSVKRNIFVFVLITLFLAWIPAYSIYAALAEPVIALVQGKGLRIGDMAAKTQVINVTEYRVISCA